eukprot:TRINITY_DN13695_c0_g1_i1.p1 TRINITY_DN13695_c0_g1~~TRINITY_DN13695_c0_g1_i1.p1  ORF type:complete len:678 (+),score=162.26 TRINITY_DN13695_c0_g1_i1:280-2034(+)
MDRADEATGIIDLTTLGYVHTLIDNSVKEYYEFNEQALTIFQQQWDCHNSDTNKFAYRSKKELEKEGCDIVSPQLCLYPDPTIKIPKELEEVFQKQCYNLTQSNTTGPISETNGVWNRLITTYSDRFELKLQIWAFDLTDHGAIRYNWDFLGLFEILGYEGSIGFSFEGVASLVNPQSIWHGFIYFMNRFLYDFLLLICNVCSLALSFKAVIAANSLMNRVNKRRDLLVKYDFIKDYEYQFSVSEKSEFFNMWFIVNILANVISAIGACMDLLIIIGVPVNRLFVAQIIGLAALLGSFNLTRYLEFSSSYYIMIASLRIGLPIVMKFLLSIFPIYLGFCALGTLYFGPTSPRWFGDFAQTSVTLFSFSNGDQMLDIYREIYAGSPLFSRLFLTAYGALLIYAVLNIFVVIMEDAYHSAKLDLEKNSRKRDYYMKYLPFLTDEINEYDTKYKELSESSKEMLENTISNDISISKQSINADPNVIQNNIQSLVNSLKNKKQAQKLNDMIEQSQSLRSDLYGGAEMTQYIDQVLSQFENKLENISFELLTDIRATTPNPSQNRQIIIPTDANNTINDHNEDNESNLE